MSFEGSTLVDWAAFQRARAELGAGFVRILGYFQEDGSKSVTAIETAMRAGNATALVIPAHTLKGEARQFGAEPLALVAETIETIARTCIETRDTPDAALPHVVSLRGLFDETMSLLQREANPLVERRPGFGRRAVTGFGQG
ncbi:MAG: Hpt domain-containing protein [Sphingomonas sp.]|nr:Hpt domain-containing protein [Sphingomonas sp.]